MITLYNFPKSGHAHRADLFLNLIGLEHTSIDVDLAGGEHKSEAYLAKNIFGQVPLLEDDGAYISDSNAILVYLATKYADEAWYPRDARTTAEIQRWLSVAANEIANGPAAARLVTVFAANLDHELAKTKAYSVLDKIEATLKSRTWLAGTDNATIADVAGYSYIAHAPEGDVSLEPYPQVREWLARIEGLKGFKPMPATAVGLAA